MVHWSTKGRFGFISGNMFATHVLLTLQNVHLCLLFSERVLITQQSNCPFSHGLYSAELPRLTVIQAITNWTWPESSKGFLWIFFCCCNCTLQGHSGIRLVAQQHLMWSLQILHLLDFAWTSHQAKWIARTSNQIIAFFPRAVCASVLSSVCHYNRLSISALWQ